MGNQRDDKKRRQFLRRESVKEYQATARVIAEADRRFIKPCPRFVPERAWIWMLGFFIHIDHGK